MKHQTMINALAKHGFNPKVDPLEPHYFTVDAGEFVGSWWRKPDGSIYALFIQEKAEVTAPGLKGKLYSGVRSFVNDLKEKKIPIDAQA